MTRCIRILAVAVFASLIMSGFSGCARQQEEAIFVYFVFNDARGITVGDKVMGDGVEVGRVIAQPKSPSPRNVVVSVRIDGLSGDKINYLTEDLTAVIRKDSLVAGQTYLDLVFPAAPGQIVESGSVLKGRGLTGDLGAITMPGNLRQFMDLFESTLLSFSNEIDGAFPTYLNLVSISVLALTYVALILDLLIRLPQAKKRERSSPAILRKAWWTFSVVVILRFFIVTLRFMGGVGIVSDEVLNMILISSSDLGSLLSQEWPFWVLVITATVLRFKLELLTTVREGK